MSLYYGGVRSDCALDADDSARRHISNDKIKMYPGENCDSRLRPQIGWCNGTWYVLGRTIYILHQDVFTQWFCKHCLSSCLDGALLWFQTWSDEIRGFKFSENIYLYIL